MRITAALLVLGLFVPVCQAQAEKPEPNSKEDFLKRPLEDSLAAMKNKDEGIATNAASALVERAFFKRESFSGLDISKLIKALSDKDVDVRITVVVALSTLGESARGTVPVLRVMLNDRSPSVRVVAADALRQLAPREKVLPVLLECLEAEDQFVRWKAADILADMPWKILAAVEPLRKCLHDKNETVRVRAARALWLINRDPAAATVCGESAKTSRPFAR